MPRLILIDPSLRGVGGHNRPYAVEILHAAESMGYSPVLATHRRFSDRSLDPGWNVLPLFRFEETDRSFLDRGRRIRRFGRDCRELFERVGYDPGDVVFLPSLREFDFVALARFLRDNPESRQPAWHVQFHFNILDGSESDHAGQEGRLRRLRRRFATAAALIPDHRLQLYCTTERLAEQYNRMGVARFAPLPYPVRRGLSPAEGRVHDGPLRVTCAGSVRLEKGRADLARLVRRLFPALEADGRLQLVIQTDRKSLGQVLPRRLARSLTILPRPDPRRDQPVVPVEYPLAPEAYVDLIRQADIGLFLYDPRRYFARCSGVLVDMLSAGIPVIVPAGTWLADQIGETHGSIVQSFEELPQRVQEMAGDYPRYRRAAIDFATRWRQDHAATRTIEALLARETGAIRAGM